MSVRMANRRSANSPKNNNQEHRKGSVIVVAVVLMFVLMGMVAFAVDTGYINLARTQAQAAADASALAAVATLHAPMGSIATEVKSVGGAYVKEARDTAREYVRYHYGGGDDLDIDRNDSNDPNGDVVLGVLRWDGDLTEPLDQNNAAYNSVRVTVRFQNDSENGPLGLFFGRVFGLNQTDVSATATAKAEYPSVLPFAVAATRFNEIYSGGDGDIWKYTAGGPGFGITSGSDGLPEIKIFPDQVSGVPGNFGIIQIGPPSTDQTQQLTHIMQQVDVGPTVDDFNYHGGSLFQNLQIDSKTGVKSTIKWSILGTPSSQYGSYPGMIGEARYLATYTSVGGNGANTNYVLDKFIAVRMMAIELDGVVYTDGVDQVAIGNTSEITGIWIQRVTDSNLLNKPHLVR